MNVVPTPLIQTQQVLQVPAGGYTESQKKGNYTDGDGNPFFGGWYSAVQPSSSEKSWKLVCVLVGCGLRVELGF